MLKCCICNYVYDLRKAPVLRNENPRVTTGFVEFVPFTKSDKLTALRKLVHFAGLLLTTASTGRVLFNNRFIVRLSPTSWWLPQDQTRKASYLAKDSVYSDTRGFPCRCFLRLDLATTDGHSRARMRRQTMEVIVRGFMRQTVVWWKQSSLNTPPRWFMRLFMSCV